jgi:hypothetical protein
MANIPEEPPVNVVDNIGAPDVFADFANGVFLFNGNVHISFSSRRCDYSRTPMERRRYPRS